MKRILLLLPILLFFLNNSVAQETSKVRFFKEVSEISFYTVLQKAQKKGKNGLVSNIGGWVKVIEVDEEHRPLNYDTLKVWVQHNNNKVGGISFRANHADLIFTCNPDKIRKEEMQEKHMFPNSEDDIWMYGFSNKFVAISNEYRKTLAFASEKHVLKDYDYQVRKIRRKVLKEYLKPRER